MIAKRIYDLAFRSLRLNDGDTASSLQLPVSSPGKLIGWAGDGTLTNTSPAGVGPGSITTTELSVGVNAVLNAVAGKADSAGLGTAAAKNTGITAGTIPLWESLLLNSTVEKTADYEVQTTDRGKLIDFTGTGSWTLSTASGLLLAAGFVFAARNSGTGVITINPYSTEQIDGASTITLSAGESCIVAPNAAATGWKTVGRPVSLPAATASNDGYMTSTYAAKLDGIEAGANVGVSANVGAWGLGAIAFMGSSTNGLSVASGGSQAGGANGFGFVIFSDGTMSISTTGATGTWKNITGVTISCTGAGIGAGTFQRIA